MSLFGEAEPEEIPVEERRLQEALIRRGSGVADCHRRISAILDSRLPGKALALKKEFGWGGSTFTWGDGTGGYYEYAPAGIRLELYGEPKQEYRFTWKQVLSILTELREEGRYPPPEQTEQISRQETVPDLTLQTLETVSVLVCQHGSSELRRVPPTREAVMELVSGETDGRPLGFNLPGTQLVWNRDWLAKELTVTIRLYEDGPCVYGPAVLVKTGEDGYPVEPDPDELERWQRIVESQAGPVDNEQVMADIRMERHRLGMEEQGHDEQWEQADRMNPTNRIDALLRKPEGTVRLISMDNHRLSLFQLLGSDSLKRMQPEPGIDLVFAEQGDPSIPGVLVGANPARGPILLLRYDEGGEYISIPPEEREQWDRLLSELPEEKEVRPEAEPEPQPEPSMFSYDGFPEAGEPEPSPRQRFRHNIAAIEMLQLVERESRSTTPEEQAVLAKYAGWGGLAEAFDSSREDWREEYQQLRELLTREEYRSARASVTTAFYTPLPLVRQIWSTLERFGLSGGRILDPAAGTGRFFGAMPEPLRENARLCAVEPDSISARITRLLYPRATVEQKGFEKTGFRDSSFDAVVTNVPFGEMWPADPKYDRHRFLLHDYFFAKALDQVRPGGIVALITSSGLGGGTFDKGDSRAREYLARRSELIGAVRLPKNAFQEAGTDVVTDLILLQRRERQLSADEPLPGWVTADILQETVWTAADGTERTNRISINPYFRQHPEMALGSLETASGPFGPVLACRAEPGQDTIARLGEALSRLAAEIPERPPEEAELLEAPPDARSYTFVIHEDRLYYCENGLLHPQNSEAGRIRSMCGIRDTTRRLLATQSNGGDTGEIRRELNRLYEQQVKRFGPLNSRTNSRLFRRDTDCNLLLALEMADSNGGWKKTDIFLRDTVTAVQTPASVERAADALHLSLNHRAGIDLEYMQALYPKPGPEILRELGELVYQNPEKTEEGDALSGWEPREEYLSGNVRRKLAVAREAAEQNPDRFGRNVAALELVQPRRIEAGEIQVRPGVPWMDREHIQQFMYETFNTPRWLQGDDSRSIRPVFNSYNGSWTIYNGDHDTGVNAREVYGTARAGAYRLLEDTLNLRDTQIRDKIDDRYVLNERETRIARGRQQLIRTAFSDWVFRDPDRRTELVDRYNRLFNAHRTRSYDGGSLLLPGLWEGFQPYGHQKNGVARILDRNAHTLLDHEVGAGKTATMIMGAYETTRLGLGRRCLFTVPNHIVGQFGKTIFQLYPDARAMVVTEKDFQRDNRQQFLSRIAYSDIDMVVMGHTQFERIPLSAERQLASMEQEAESLSDAIAQMKAEQGARWTVKQMETQRSNLEATIERLRNDRKKDPGITFEEMGFDTLFVDEADLFKNCYIFTKMKNVAGIGGAASQRAADMLMKTRYLNETGGKIVFATGTPISNALSEMYVMQRYLQEDDLHARGIYHFDQWVTSFAEATTSLEQAPEGKGFRLKTRLARYFNVDELQLMYHTVADVQTAEMLDLPRPDLAGGEPQIITCPPSEELQEWVQEGVERCRRIRDRQVDPKEDNMLKFNTEARLAGLDMRLIDPSLPPDPEGKLMRTAGLIRKHYDETMAERGFQMVFCDFSTPNPHRFNVYDELKRNCMELGIPGSEIAFIHDAKNSRSREELFRKCREGEVRVLVGSTEKCGAGTNIQNRMIAEYHLDCPYRPRDITQREGRGWRQGNRYRELHIYRLVTEGSYDSYLWSILVNKQRFITQFRQGCSGQRTFEDKDETLLGFEAVQAVASGNPLIMERITLENQVSNLKLLQAEHRNVQFRLEDKLRTEFPARQAELEQQVEQLRQDIRTLEANTGQEFRMEVAGQIHTAREEAGAALNRLGETLEKDTGKVAGQYRGMELQLRLNPLLQRTVCVMSGAGIYTSELSPSGGVATTTRMDNVLKNMPHRLVQTEQELAELEQQKKDAAARLKEPFASADELKESMARLAELDALLNLDRRELPEEAREDIMEDGLEL